LLQHNAALVGSGYGHASALRDNNNVLVRRLYMYNVARVRTGRAMTHSSVAPLQRFLECRKYGCSYSSVPGPDSLPFFNRGFSSVLPALYHNVMKRQLLLYAALCYRNIICTNSHSKQKLLGEDIDISVPTPLLGGGRARLPHRPRDG